MIPILGTNPEVNVITIGAKILVYLGQNNFSCSVDDIFEYFQQSSNLSLDHIILSLDWLYAIKAIDIKENQVLICKF
ncbi:ABC-three component system middle component 6 [Acinetobacter faecalis]|uniref:ABC-three component system middle component 6 n=1 Tax=Acinetobacter faecalis TaxID=2665161 RepID=UPI002A91FB1F|nr:ABC-three component system middle component 6 [Acinetobacter faecalis]MDY6449883.1 ABC-three component system middle component 6 [Acinetobacter faecalis]